MEDQLKELIPFLRDKNPQVRQIALSNLLGQTPEGSPHRNIFFRGLGGGLQKPKETDIVRDLKLLCRDQLAVAHDAFRALVNLSDSPLLVPFLSEPAFLTFLVSYILNADSILADLASMLLSNLTASSSPCAALLALKVPIISTPSSSSPFFPTQSRSGTCSAPVPYPSGEPQDILALPLLIDTFVHGASIDPSGDLSSRKRKGELHFLASVFANISTSPAGRTFFVTPQQIDPLNPKSTNEYPLAKIVAFTEHKDTIRRGGVASTLKNCAFHAQAHRAILSPDTEAIIVPPSTVSAPGIDALPSILLPLAGPEELDLDDQEKLPSALQLLPPTKKREADSALRLMHVETLLLLCTTRWGRDYLRDNGVYEIVRGAHMEETVEKVSEYIERLVQLLKGDEGVETTDGSDVARVGGQDDDDDDNRIEEV
ncbi:uncharacterized protein EDB91DRAFT_1137061 [Suillus paluster]|uniref:uncharacterized protein n=1 Tax=Suillus paluster TaxID=48578 RepID=UPI001B86AF75|nr:uncharacterized protein EDB91DRAFT_1137061 [Suillus paluster]KAG1738879.1 hypothetical protein EDB91DRAFT_1137061 [Suillus paluster]